MSNENKNELFRGTKGNYMGITINHEIRIKDPY